MEEKFYKVGDKVPQVGRYQCVICGVIMEFLPQHIEKGVLFNSCPLCAAGTENGPKKPNEDIWKLMG